MPKNRGWFRVYDRAFRNPKLITLDDPTMNFLFHLWGLASEADDDGNTAHTAETFVRICTRWALECVRNMVLTLTNLELVFVRNDCKIVVRNWKEHQYITDSKSPEYQRTYMQHWRKTSIKSCKKNVRNDCKNDVRNQSSLDQNIYKPPIVPLTKGESCYSEDFESFWQAYPRKVGKGAAWKAWEKTVHPSLAELLATLERQKKAEQWRKDKGQFIPHPATWLHQARWLDEPAVDVVAKEKKLAREKALANKSIPIMAQAVDSTILTDWMRQEKPANCQLREKCTKPVCPISCIEQQQKKHKGERKEAPTSLDNIQESSIPN